MLPALPAVQGRIAQKTERLERDCAVKAPAAHRAEELARMRRIFFDPQQPCHALRRASSARRGNSGATPQLPLSCL